MLDGESLQPSLEDFKGALIKRFQGAANSIHPKKNCPGRLQAAWEGARHLGVEIDWMWDHGRQPLMQRAHKLVNIVTGSSGRIRLKNGARELKRGSKNEICGAGQGVLTDGCPVTHQDRGKVVNPGRAILPGHQALFKGAVKTLHHSIGLWVVSCCCRGGDAQGSHQIPPEGRDKLSTLVRHEIGGHTIAGNPSIHESPDSVLCRHGVQRHSLHTTGKSVYYGE